MTDTLIAPQGPVPALPCGEALATRTATQAPVTPAPVTPATPALETGALAVGEPASRMSLRARMVRFGVLAAAVAACGVAATTLPLQTIADAVTNGLGPAAAVAIAVVGGLLLSVLVPRTAITLACGALLGPSVGAATALAAAILAAVATYYAGRWAGRGALTARSGGRLDRLDGWLNKRGLAAVLLVRFLPLAPFGLVGYAYGTTSVCRKQYLLGTTLAAIPSAITYAVIGAAVAAPGEMSPLTLAPALIGFTLTTTIVVRWRRASRRASAAALLPA